MKKFKTIFVALLVLTAMVFSFAACTSEGSDTQSGKTYKIVCQSGDNYTLSSSLESAKKGEKVVITIKVDELFEVESVKANDVECQKNLAGQYEFVMPEEDVTVTASVKAQADINLDDGMYWQKYTNQLSVVNAEDSFMATYEFEINFGSEYVANSTDSESNMIYTKVHSTNQNVIPDEAFSRVSAGNVINGSMATEAKFSVDLKKVKTGTTKIVFEDTDNDRMITKTIQVVAYGEVRPDNLYQETVIVDLTKLSGQYDNLRIWIYDSDYVYGSVYEEYQFADFKYSDGKFEYTFSYTPDHTFTIAIGYEYYDENVQDTRYANFAIENTIIGGSTDTGFTGIVSDGDGYKISFRADGEKITAVVKEK